MTIVVSSVEPKRSPSFSLRGTWLLINYGSRCYSYKSPKQVVETSQNRQCSHGGSSKSTQQDTVV